MQHSRIDANKTSEMGERSTGNRLMFLYTAKFDGFMIHHLWTNNISRTREQTKTSVRAHFTFRFHVWWFFPIFLFCRKKNSFECIDVAVFYSIHFELQDFRWLIHHARSGMKEGRVIQNVQANQDRQTIERTKNTNFLITSKTKMNR